jgi:hypothetical protein
VAVRIQCDVCDYVASPDTWQGLAMTIPGELLGTFTGEELEIHVCSWRCVYILGRDKIGMTPDDEMPDELELVKKDEPDLVYDREEVVTELIQRNARAGAKADQAAITWGNNPDAGLKQPDADIPLGGITRDKQQIRLRRKD